MLNIHKPSTVSSVAANDASISTSNTSKKRCIVPESQFVQDGKEIQKSNVGPSSVPATQFQVKMALENNTMNVIPETQPKNLFSLNIDDIHSDNDDEVSEVNTQADLFEED